MSAVAVAEARSLALAERAEVEFRVGNVVDAALPADFDVIVTSLFLHHLTRADAVRLLAAMSQTARRLVVVNDLRRSTAGYLLAQAVCRLITRSPVVHVDGPRSVAGAFTMAEMRQMCVDADLTPIRLVALLAVPVSALLGADLNRHFNVPRPAPPCAAGGSISGRARRNTVPTRRQTA